MSVFDCKMCGHCCEGRGGIILGPRDLKRICDAFKMDERTWLSQYAELMNGKYTIRVGEDNRCIFFKDGVGCSIHTFKPDVCRAWPFFHGNMVDNVSLFMAKDFCPGISKDATHAEFVSEGRQYLKENGLVAHNANTEAVALLPDNQ